MDRATGFEPVSWEFESLRGHLKGTAMTELTELVSEGPLTNKQVALLAAVQLYSGRQAYVEMITDVAGTLYRWLEDV
jgi:hypothetical protein